MATAYHLEALRKQRMLERMAGAQIRLEQAELVCGVIGSKCVFV